MASSRWQGPYQSVGGPDGQRPRSQPPACVSAGQDSCWHTLSPLSPLGSLKYKGRSLWRREFTSNNGRNWKPGAQASDLGFIWILYQMRSSMSSKGKIKSWEAMWVPSSSPTLRGKNAEVQNKVPLTWRLRQAPRYSRGVCFD